MPDAKAPAAPTCAPIDKAKAAVGGGVGLSLMALSLAVSGIKSDEGERSVDYLDLAKVPTACFGHTGSDVHVGKHRTPAECLALLNTDVRIRMNGVAACVPALRGRSYQWAASTRMAYNTDVQAFCGSSTARAFRADQWRAGCDAMLLWNKAVVRGVKVVVPGLTARRERERAQCFTEV